MSIPAIIQHKGSVIGSRAAGSLPFSVTETMPTDVNMTLSGSRGSRPSVVNATAGSPFVIPLETINRVRFLSIQTVGGGGTLRLTSAAGVLQQIPLGSGALFLWASPAPGDELTAIQFVGNADLQYVLAGDP